MKNEKVKGITLIALVITIIVLLILAGVTIAAISGNEGVLNKAQSAKDKTEIANAKEQAQLLAVGYIQDYYSGKYVTGGVTSYSNVGDYVLYRFGETPTYGNYKYEVDGDTLKVYSSSNKYLVEGDIGTDGTIGWNDGASGEDLTPTDPNPVVPTPPAATGVTITNNSNKTTITTAETLSLSASISPSGAEGTITWSCTPAGAVTFSPATGANTTVTPVNTGNVTITASTGSINSTVLAITIESDRLAKNVLTLTEDPNDSSKLVKTYVNYTFPGDSTPTTCLVMYNDEEHGLQIIPESPITKVKLGSGDNIGATGSTDLEKTQNSYQNAVANLNEKAKLLAGVSATQTPSSTNLAQDARCVGSLPDVNAGKTEFSREDEQIKYVTEGGVTSQETVGKFTNSNFTTSYDNQYWDADENYKEDETRLQAIGAYGFSSTTNGDNYWLASRYVNAWLVSTFVVRVVSSSGDLGWYGLWELKDNESTYTYQPELGFRPVILLKSGVQVKEETGKDGTTAEKAYNLVNTTTPGVASGAAII